MRKVRIRRLYVLFLFELWSGLNPLSAQPGRPNIIYIYADDLGYSDLGCYGQQKIHTPNLDRMAKEGVRFTHHYSGAPVCAPSRCMLLTGRHAGHAAIRANEEFGGFSDDQERGQFPLPDTLFTVAEMLRNCGYQTAMIGKWGLGVVASGGSPLKHGFDFYYGYLDQKQAHNFYPTHLWENDRWDTLDNQYVYVHQSIDSLTAADADFQRYSGNVYAPEKMTSKALWFIRENQHQPFFLYLPYTLPHLSLQVPDKYVDQYKGQFEEYPYFGQSGYAPCKYPKSTYAAMVTFLDEQVGMILSELKRLGIDENTVVFFSSDNGATNHPAASPSFFQSKGHLRGFKGELYEGGIRVPLIVRWPGKIRAGDESQHICTQYDMLATFAEITGSVEIASDGVSFLPTILGKNHIQKKHAWLYFEFPENGGHLAVQWQGWKAVRRRMLENIPEDWELYYLPDDPGEKNNQAEFRPDVILSIEKIVAQAHAFPLLKHWDVINRH